MTYPVFIYGSPVLRKKAVEIDNSFDQLDEFLENMFETMEKSEGVGLAAPQVGRSLRVFVVDSNPLAEDDPSLSGFRKAFINPKILDFSGEDKIYQEGCLSIPNIREEVTRPEKIKIEYYDQQFQKHIEEYEGTKARIIQHEYDHLEGILFVDRLNGLKKRLLKSKLQAISKGKFEVEYKVKLAR